MFSILFWWFLMGIVGTAIIFQDDLRTRTNWDDADLTVGQLLTYLFMTLGGPAMLFWALRDTKFLELLMEQFGNLVWRIVDTKVYTFKKREKTNESH